MDEQLQSRLARKGAKHNSAYLVEQACCSLEQFELHSARLGSYGFGAERRESLLALLNQVQSGIGTRQGDITRSLHASQTTRQAQDAAKALIRKLRIAAPMVVREGAHPSVTLERFRSGGKLRRSSSRIGDYFNLLRPLLVELEEGFRPYFAGGSVVKLLDEVAAGLRDASSDHECRRAGRPIETLKLNLAKGELLEMIEDLNRVAQLAFSDQPAIAAQFGLRILRRGKHSRGGRQDKTVEAPGSEEAAAVPAVTGAAAPPATQAKAEQPVAYAAAPVPRPYQRNELTAASHAAMPAFEPARPTPPASDRPADAGHPVQPEETQSTRRPER